MIFYIILFFIAIITALGMLVFRSWEIKTMRVRAPEFQEKRGQIISFNYLEKSFLYIIRRLVLVIVVASVKSWFIVITKTKKWTSENLPRVHNLFKSKPQSTNPRRHSFISQTILESKTRIGKIKERIKKEHE